MKRQSFRNSMYPEHKQKLREIAFKENKKMNEVLEELIDKRYEEINGYE